MNQLINIYDQSSISELNIKRKEGVHMRSFIYQSLITFTALVNPRDYGHHNCCR